MATARARGERAAQPVSPALNLLHFRQADGQADRDREKQHGNKLLASAKMIDKCQWLRMHVVKWQGAWAGSSRG